MRRTALVTLVLLTGIFAGTGLWLHARQRQYALNRQLIDALVRRDDKQALILINHGADPNTRYDPKSHFSLKDMFNQLIHRSRLSVTDNPTALSIACGATWIDDNATFTAQVNRPAPLSLVEGMLRHGADIEARDKDRGTPLLWAVFIHRPGTVGLLLDHGADVNATDKDGRTSLVSAMEAGDSSMVRLLLAHKANINLKDRYGRTPLISAINDNLPRMVQILVANGANVNAADEDNVTPLIAAIRSHANTDVVHLLVAHGANINARTRAGRTSLMFAVRYDPVLSTVHLLLEHGIEVNAQDEDGWTALYFAVHYASSPPDVGTTNVIRQLLSHGARVDLPTRDGDTALKYAQRLNRPDFVALLRHSGAEQ